MKRLVIVLLVCAVLLPALPVSTAQPPNSDAPYIYYYSERLNAFVIERADGSDSRLFGEGLLHEETVGVSGAGWSPSGEWFGFVSLVPLVDTTIERGGDVIHVSGTRTLTSIEAFKANIQFMMWADDRDLLFISTTTSIDNSSQLERGWYLVDATDDTVIASFETRSEVWFYKSMIRQYDNYFLFGSFDSEELQMVYYRWSFDGDLTEVARNQMYNEQNYGISPNGWTLYEPEPYKYSAINLITELEIPLDTPEKISLNPEWSEYGAIVYGRTGSIWYFDGNRNIFEALPSEFSESFSFFDRDLWSPDERYFLLWNDTSLFIFDAETQELNELMLTFSADTVKFTEFYWDTEGRLILYDRGDINQVIVYEEGSVSHLDIPMHYNSIVAFSPGKPLVAMYGMALLSTIWILRKLSICHLTAVVI